MAHFKYSQWYPDHTSRNYLYEPYDNKEEAEKCEQNALREDPILNNQNVIYIGLRFNNKFDVPKLLERLAMEIKADLDIHGKILPSSSGDHFKDQGLYFDIEPAKVDNTYPECLSNLNKI